MKFFQYLYISCLFIFLCTKTRTLKEQNLINPIADKKHAIIFDLTNVIIKENQIGFAKKIGYGTLASYTITHWKSPGYRCLDMLAEMSKHESQKPHITITLQSRTMPRCLVELQEGKKTCAQTKTEIAQCIELLATKKFFSSTKEKTLMINIMNLVLDPETIASIIEPNKSTIQLVQKLKKAGYPIYLCANAPEELYATAHNKFPDIIQLFDGIVISSQVKTVKPDETIFNHLLSAHNLDPAHCILIDDLEESAATARKLGMQAIVFDKASHVTNKLKKCGIKI
jgi:HAD superfamily hydrolase (TIGR01509 family)